MAVGLNIFYFIYFVNISIYLHKHYMSKINIQKGFETSYIAYVNSFPFVPEHQIKTL